MKLNIKCTLEIPGKEPVESIITDAIKNFAGDPDPFRVVINGNSYPLCWILVNGINLSTMDNYDLIEWFKGYQYYLNEGKTEYFFEENGLEYWYGGEDFKKHYTYQEG